MSLQVASPFQQFFDSSGSPLDNGFVYVGTVNLNPETNPLTVYFDDALTIPAAQPLRTSNGYIVRNGSPARVYTSQESFSLTVREKNKVLVFTVADATSLSNLATQLASGSGSSLVGYNQGNTGAVDRTVQSRLRDFVSVKDFGAVGDGVADDTAALQEALDQGISVFLPAGTYNVSDTLFTKSNGIKVYGENGKAYSGGQKGTVISSQFTTNNKPVLDVFTGTGASSAQLVTIEDIAFVGSQDFIVAKNAGTPITTGPIGIYGGDTTTGNTTKDSFEIRRCTFRKLKKAFTIKGFIHYVDDCYINNCYEAYDISSTQSTTVSKTVIQTTVNQWGTISGVKHVDCTIQQGVELQALVQDKGFVCDGYVAFENCFFEGGSSQIYLNDSKTAEVLNCFMGFTILSAGGYGHSNFRTGTGSNLWVRGGRKGGTSSFLVNNADAASVVWLDFAEPYTTTIQSASNILNAPTFKIFRSFGVHERINYQNKINYTSIVLTSATASKLFNLTNATFGEHNGWLKVGISMSSSYDLYEVSFAGVSSVAAVSTINIIQRNTGGTGLNNVTLAVDGSYNVTVARNKAEDCDVWFAIESYGNTYLIDPATL